MQTIHKFSFSGFNFQRIRALIIKEMHQIFRDPSSFLIAVFFPILLLLIYGYGVSLDMNDLQVGLVMQDTSPEAQTFSLSLKNSKFFTIESSTNQKELEYRIIQGKLKGMVVVPFYFSEYKNRPDEKGPIYVVGDGSEPNTANFVQNYVLGAWNNFLIQQSLDNPATYIPKVSIQPRFWYNEELNSRNFLIPGSIAIIMTLIGTILTALVMAREWERGTIEALFATPTRVGEILLSKMISYFCLGIGSMTLCTLFALIVYQIPFRGTFIALLIVSSMFLLVALAVGLLISTMARSQFVACQIALIVAFLPAFMLSGFIFEIASMPLPIRILSHLIPAKYMVSCLQTIFLVGDVWKLLIFNIIFLALFAALLWIILITKTVKRLD